MKFSSPSSFFIKHSQVILLNAILGVAAFLRLYNIDQRMRFIWDEGRDMLAIRTIIVERNLTFFGPFNEIDGKIDFFGVFHYYLMLPSLWLANLNPVGPAIFTAILGVAAVGLSFIWARRFLDFKSAIAVSALMATSPLVVRYTLWPWNPNTTGFFGILFLLSLQRWQIKPKYRLSMFAGVLLGLLFQLHYFTIVLGVSALFVVLWQKKLELRQKIVHSLVFVASFILPNLSFVIFDITHEGFYRNILLDSFLGESSHQLLALSPLELIVAIPNYLWRLSSDFVGIPLLGIVIMGAFGAWLCSTFVKFLKVKQTTEEFQLAVAWCTFFVLVLLFPALIDNYHSAPLWIGVALSFVKSFKPFWQKLSWSWQIILFLMVIGGLSLSNRFWKEPSWDAQMPRIKEISKTIAQDASQFQDINIASFVDPDTRATRFRYFLATNETPVLSFDQYPVSQVLYIVTPYIWEETKQNTVWELETFVNSTSTEIWSDEKWRVYRLEK